MTTKGLALAASIIAFSTISGMAHAKTAMHEHGDKVERSSSPSQMQAVSSDSVATFLSSGPETNPHTYHGGPKSID